MRQPPRIAWLPDVRRLHLQDGPIDLIVQAFGERAAIEAAYRAAAARFVGLLDELCRELGLLRSPARPGKRRLQGAVASCMEAAVLPFAGESFITPMAAVAGSVADAVLAAMVATGPLARAYVNNGGDIALHCAAGQRLTIGLVDRPDRPSLFGDVVVMGEDAARGVATSGWRGRSFSLGIADSVTVLARTAGQADAAATVIANAVDLPGHPGVRRVPAQELQPDSDLGARPVTRHVEALGASDIDIALAAGVRCADDLMGRGLIIGAALQVQGVTRTTGMPARLASKSLLSDDASRWPRPSPRGEGGTRRVTGGADAGTDPAPSGAARHLPLAGEGHRRLTFDDASRWPRPSPRGEGGTRRVTGGADAGTDPAPSGAARHLPLAGEGHRRLTFDDASRLPPPSPRGEGGTRRVTGGESVGTDPAPSGAARHLPLAGEGYRSLTLDEAGRRLQVQPGSFRAHA